MVNNDNDLLESLIPHLRDHLAHLKAEKEVLDAKIKEVERKLVEISSGDITSNIGRQRRPRGANRVLLKKWFQEHPTAAVGQAEVANKTDITSSSARAALDKLTKDGFLEREGSLWRLKRMSPKPEEPPF